ncbi:MAG TPA: hypothetical protein PLP09_06815 [Petrotogaceae bacterium]|nr:hypothetical protein [Petrotogaceae bacterium]
MGTSKNKGTSGAQGQVKISCGGSASRSVSLLCFILTAALLFAIPRVGLVYEGPQSVLNSLIYTLYKYADIQIPPDYKGETFVVEADNDKFSLRYSLGQIQAGTQEFDSIFSKIFPQERRSVFIIGKECTIKSEDKFRSADFFYWEEKLNLTIQASSGVYDYVMYPRIGDNVLYVPKKWVKLFITAEKVSEITLNGQRYLVPCEVTVPDCKLTLDAGDDSFEIDLTNYEGDEYRFEIAQTDQSDIIKTAVMRVFEIESGIFISGFPYSVWLSKGQEPKISKSQFFCDYGDIRDVKKGTELLGDIIFVHEHNKSVYIISSAGEVVVLGRKQSLVPWDLLRAPFSIELSEKGIEIKTMQLKKYVMSFEGGLSSSQLYEDIKFNIPSFKPLDTYEFEDFEIKIYSSYIKILRHEVKAK